MICMRADKVAYYLSDCTLPFYVEYEFDAIPFASLLKEAALSQTVYKRELLFLKMFAVRKSIDLHLDAARAERLWGLYLKEMERVYAALLPREKERIKADLKPALDTYGSVCQDSRAEESAGKHFASRLGLSEDSRVARYASNVFWQKSNRCKRYLSGRIWFKKR